uniref:bidirectional sugar transporter SWEET9-like n=1 Tax=Erigeron canadensis TaxID=72917 RepID=UPI001CB8AAB7|nr:bidirectional sugar transporter SWEET9-like [Erigeron canadensis]
MMIGNLAHLTLAFGLLGNLVSFMVFVSPIPTFYKVYKMKSTEGFQSAPYVVSLFSAMLWIYYALLKTNTMLIITINSVGCFVQTIYICFYLFYSSKKARMESMKLIVLLIVVGFGLIVALTQFLASGVNRAMIVGWICLVFSLCVFLAPMGVLRQVVKTKSVEFMPLLLSVALTINAITWFFYGLLIQDINIAIPNILGFSFGVVQLILYFIYKNKTPVLNKKMVDDIIEDKICELEPEVVKEQKILIDDANLICSEILPVVRRSNSSSKSGHDQEDDCVAAAAMEPKKPCCFEPSHTIIQVAA